MDERETILSLVRLEDGSLTMEILPDHEQVSLAIVPDEKLFKEFARTFEVAFDSEFPEHSKWAKIALDELVEGWEGMQDDEEDEKETDA